MTVLHCDVETRSTVDLRKTGAHIYACHPTTDLWCAAYALDDEPVRMWWPHEPFPPEIELHVDMGGEIVCHDSQFERVIWWAILGPRYGWPRPAIEQFSCTMTRAYAMSLPGSLEQAAHALGLDVQKDAAGHRLMMQMAKPRRIEPDGTIVWWDDAERRERLGAYCAQDVEVERVLHKRLLRLSPAEQRLWHLDQKINDRGVSVDVAACQAANRLVERTKKSLDAEMRRATGNAVAACSAVSQLTDWLKLRGVQVEGVAKADVLELLDTDLPADCRLALELRREGSKSSTAKVDAMIQSADRDGRMRGLVQYHGAATGRWAGRRAQVHNYPRTDPDLSPDDIAEFIDLMKREFE